MVEAFNLIEFFGVAALFGWLTFLVATDDMVKRIEQDREDREQSQGGETKDTEKTKKQRQKDEEERRKKNEESQKRTRTTLNAINDYFIISFVFYAIAALADYFFKHHTVLGESAEYGLAGLTVAAFAAGTMLLALPVVYLLLLDHGRDVFVQRRDYALCLCIATVANIVMLALVLPKYPPSSRSIIAVPSLLTIVGFSIAMTGKMTVRRFIVVLAWFLLSWAAVALLVALKMTYWDFSPILT